MNVAAIGLAALIVAAAVAAVAARDGRLGLSGLLVLLSLAPMLGEPLPTPAALAVREVGALLVVMSLRATITAHPGGSRLGWASEALIAAAVAIGGLAIAFGIADLTSGLGAGPVPADLGARVTPNVLALAAGAAALGLGLRPIFGTGDASSTTVGLLVAIAGIALVRTGLAGPPGDVEHLALVGLTVAVAASGAAVAHAADRP